MRGPMMNDDLRKQLDGHLAKFPDAGQFLLGFGFLCHAIDDLIDRDNARIENYPMLVLDCYNLALDVYSSRFYHDNHAWLYPVAKNIHRVYSASIAWEKHSEEWKARYADVLRCCGNEMIVAVLEHTCHLPYCELRKIDAALREDSWHIHHDNTGKPI